MKQNGRKSAAQRSVENIVKLKVFDGGGAPQERAAPPSDLTPRQAEIWQAIVRDEPVDFFSTNATQMMLKALVQAVESLEIVQATINMFEPSWLKSGNGAKRYHEYIKSRSLCMADVAKYTTKLRLTNQARYTPKAAGTASNNTLKGNKPWEWDPPFK